MEESCWDKLISFWHGKGIKSENKEVLESDYLIQIKGPSLLVFYSIKRSIYALITSITNYRFPICGAIVLFLLNSYVAKAVSCE